MVKDCECIKSLLENLVVICDEIVDTPDSASISLRSGINYWLIPVVLLAIAGLLILMAIIINYYMKHELTIPCLLLY